MNKILLVLLLVVSLCLSSLQAQDICKNHQNGVLLPYPKDCGKYVVCRGSKPHILRTCPLGLHFICWLSVCDAKERADCNLKQENPIVSEQVLDSSTGPSGTACTISGNCAGKPVGTLISNADSNGYIVCQCQNEIKMSCAPGTIFDEALQTCVHNGWVGNCGSPTPTLAPPTPAPPTPAPTTPTPPTTTPPTPPLPSPAPPTPPPPTPATTPPSPAPPTPAPPTSSPSTPAPPTPAPTTPPPPTPATTPPSPALPTPAPPTSSPPTPAPPTLVSPTPPTPPTPAPQIPATPSTGPSGTTCTNSEKCVGQPDGTMFADPNSNGYIVCQCQCEIKRPCAPGTAFNESLQTCDHIGCAPAIKSDHNHNSSWASILLELLAIFYHGFCQFLQNTLFKEVIAGTGYELSLRFLL
ncbi:selenoprotein V [Stomoxys calcitrans]|uniref:selenoprotein V n=1 Tax=Stomoxys calcitrans TaxID=35570 RepID=UPI0027E38516|nr:selenoprotein V [Stomoxys calcitrans]